jgi:hypothetical protein
MKKLFPLLAIAIAFTLNAIGQDAPLDTYVGKYNFPQGSPVPMFEVKIKDGVLFGESQMGVSTFQRVEADIFSIVEYGGTAEFKRNGDGKVVSVTVSVGDVVLEGTKESIQLNSIRFHPLSPMKF